jgi:AMMECR1 domain-containing protein
LGPIEKVESTDCLDPRIWGVVVTAGKKRGVLLPALKGVDSVARQLAIAREKAGISEGVPLEIDRFSVERHSEDGESP